MLRSWPIQVAFIQSCWSYAPFVPLFICEYWNKVCIISDCFINVFHSNVIFPSFRAWWFRILTHKLWSLVWFAPRKNIVYSAQSFALYLGVIYLTHEWFRKIKEWLSAVWLSQALPSLGSHCCQLCMKYVIFLDIFKFAFTVSMVASTVGFCSSLPSVVVAE